MWHFWFVALSSAFLFGLPVEPPPAGTESNPPAIGQNISPGGVNTRTGSFSTSRVDIQLRGPGIVFTHTYNSNDTRTGPFGPGWTHNYNIHLAIPNDSSDEVILVGPQGRSDHYKQSGAGVFSPPPGVSTELKASPDGKLSAVSRDQTVFKFDENGRLSAIVDRYGVAIPLMYNDGGWLTSIGDPDRGPTLALTYDPATARLLSVGLPDDPVSTNFGYDDLGRLATLTDRTGATTTYTYEADSQRLTSITNPLGNVVLTNTYDDRGRVVTQTDAGGAITTYNYPD